MYVTLRLCAIVLQAGSVVINKLYNPPGLSDGVCRDSRSLRLRCIDGLQGFLRYHHCCYG